MKDYQKVTMHAPKTPMNRRAIPANAAETMWHAADGWPIRRIDWQASTPPRGSLLFLPGRGDRYEKYLETLAYYADTPAPHAVLAHSMGGQLAMRALVEKTMDPDAVALSAPMLGIQTGGLPLALNHAVAKLIVALGKGKQAAWKVSEKPLSPMSMRGKMLTHDDDRYEDEIAWWALRPEVKLGPPSWHWVERAMASIRLLERPGALEAVQTPILLLATTADQLVSTKRVIADSKRLPHAETLIFGKEAAHELLREADGVRDQCLKRIDAFLDQHAPRP